MNKRNIPKAAFIEAQVLHRAVRNGALVPYVRLVERYYGMESQSLERGVYLETRVLSLLYLLIVVPKELWELDEAHPIYAHISREWPLKNIAVRHDESPWQDPIYRFIHHLRNSLAHANFEFDKGTFEFWDKSTKGLIRYRAAMSTAALEEFLEIVGARLANLTPLTNEN